MQHKAKIAWTIGVFLIGVLGFIGVKSMKVLNQKKDFCTAQKSTALLAPTSELGLKWDSVF